MKVHDLIEFIQLCFFSNLFNMVKVIEGVENSFNCVFLPNLFNMVKVFLSRVWRTWNRGCQKGTKQIL